MAQFFVEDAAHDAVLKTLHFQGNEIRICFGKPKVISLTLGESQSIGLIDEDDSTTRPELGNIGWKEDDDFNYSIVDGKMFIRFSNNVEDWLTRVSKEAHINFPGNPGDLHGKIKSNNHEARQFLEALRDSSANSPLQILRKLIRNHLGQ